MADAARDAAPRTLWRVSHCSCAVALLQRAGGEALRRCPTAFLACASPAATCA
jgi:hypothetical protein